VAPTLRRTPIDECGLAYQCWSRDLTEEEEGTPEIEEKWKGRRPTEDGEERERTVANGTALARRLQAFAVAGDNAARRGGAGGGEE
jgi:hypothetical protein